MQPALLAIAALLSGGLLAHRVLRERDPLLVGALAPLLGASLALIGANARLEGLALAGAVALPGLLLLPVRGPGLEAPALGRGSRWLLGLLVGAVLIYTHYAQVRFLDTDNWIHEPLITSYRLGLFPPVNPFFPHLSMNGHYGRDLLVATFTAPGADPLGTVWLLNPLLQVAAFLTLFASVRSLTGRFSAGVLVATLLFFGVDVGFRVGLVDTFDGNNGMVYALLALGLHLLFRLFRPMEGPGWAAPASWVVSGAVLGIYQVVYETHFGLLLLTGATLGCLFPSRRAWAALLVAAAVALPMAATEGGPITDLVRRAGRTAEARVVQNQSQQVTVRFPKEHLFQVLATDSTYQRTSAAYRTRLFSGLYRPPQGSGYMSIFDPRFLTTHWLPLYLAPFTLVACWRRRSLEGMGFWAFGAWAYLVPGLVDFGPVYEWEYFRWEFAAGVGFAGALAMALSWWLEPPRALRLDREVSGWALRFSGAALPWTVAVLILVATLAAGQKLLNGMLIDLQGKRPPLLVSPERWRTLQADLSVSEADLQAARWLSRRLVPGERFLSNRTGDTPAGIWPDAVFSTLSGALPAGHALPPRSESTHAGPPFHADALARAFWATGRVDLLQAAGIRWLYVDEARLEPEVAAALDGAGTSLRLERFEGRRLYEVMPGSKLPPSEPPFEAEAQVPGDLRVGVRYPLAVTVRNPDTRVRDLGRVRVRVLFPDGTPTQETPLDLAGGAVPPGEGVEVAHSLVTPLDEGDYLLQVSLPETVDGRPYVLATLPFRVDFLTRLASLKPRLDLPDSFRKRQFYRMRLGLTSASALASSGELELSYRLRRPGGEYVWEIDSIPQPLDLALEPGVEQEAFFQLLTPADPGAYDLELFLKDLATGRPVPLGPPVRVVVGE